MTGKRVELRSTASGRVELSWHDASGRQIDRREESLEALTALLGEPAAPALEPTVAHRPTPLHAWLGGTGDWLRVGHEELAVLIDPALPHAAQMLAQLASELRGTEVKLGYIEAPSFSTSISADIAMPRFRGDSNERDAGGYDLGPDLDEGDSNER